jgi:4-amino-4-deoxy-L-arabinose transferase-like glycosyltransferase
MKNINKNLLIQYTLIYFLGVTVSICWLLFVINNLPGIGIEEQYESGKYWVPALNILNTGEYLPTSDRLPGYPIFIAIIFYFFGLKNFMAVVICQCLLSGLSVLGLAIAARAINKNYMWLCAILACVWPNLLYPATVILPDFLFTLITIWSVCILVWSGKKKKNKGLLILAGILMGIAYMVKPLMVLFPIIVLPAFILYIKNSHSYSVLKSSLLGVIPILIMLIFTVPQYVRNYNEWGHGVFSIQAGDHAAHIYSCLAKKWGCGEANSDAYSNLIDEYKREVDNLSEENKENIVIKDKIKRKLAKNYIIELPILHLISSSVGGFIKMMSHNILYPMLERFQVKTIHFSEVKADTTVERIVSFLYENMFNKWMLLWTFIQMLLFLSRIIQVKGLLSGLANKEYRYVTLLIISVSVAFSIVTVGFGNPRYRIPIEPMLILLAVFGIKVNIDKNYLKKLISRNYILTKA